MKEKFLTIRLVHIEGLNLKMWWPIRKSDKKLRKQLCRN